MVFERPALRISRPQLLQPCEQDFYLFNELIFYDILEIFTYISLLPSAGSYRCLSIFLVHEQKILLVSLRESCFSLLVKTTPLP